MTTKIPETKEYLKNIILDEKTITRRAPAIEHERAVAIHDILGYNRFAPVGDFAGPYQLVLGINDESRLVWQIQSETGATLVTHIMGLQPFRRLVKDYFAICESYFEAIKTASTAQIETIDMARRGIHDDAAKFLSEKLEGKIAVDHATARRLFTLVCVLHVR
ncbi:MAG: UPF0262 family protein, partial [Pseudomonadota bacterium]